MPDWVSQSVKESEEEKPGMERTKMTFDKVDTAAQFFHVLYYHRAIMFWQGVQIVKNHFDMARYADIIMRLQPACIIETGAQNGGGTLYFMELLEFYGLHRSPVVSIDPGGGWMQPVKEFGHPLVTIAADCLAAEAVAIAKKISEDARQGTGKKNILISLDSVHTKSHVAKELAAYAPICAVAGDYLVVEDTDHNGHPVMSEYGPSAWEAVQEFLANGAPFTPDTAIEKAYGPITNSPSGWLVRN